MTTSPSIFKLVNEQKGEIRILHLKGRLDAISSPEAEHTIFSYIEEEQPKLIFDLREVNYISSAGLRTLLSIKKRVNSLNGKLILCSVQNNVMEIFNISGFNQILEFSKDEIDAVNMIKQNKKTT